MHIDIPYNIAGGFCSGSAFEIKKYKWTDGVKPRVRLFLAHNGASLFVKFQIFEANPAAVYAEDDCPVYKDSAAEFFLKPFSDDSRYINIEINSKGAAVFGIGSGKTARTPITSAYKSFLGISAELFKRYWTVSFAVPFGLLAEIYGRAVTAENIMRANFYKCGDETPYPHYGMLFEVDNSFPEFHLPEFFGELRLKKADLSRI